MLKLMKRVYIPDIYFRVLYHDYHNITAAVRSSMLRSLWKIVREDITWSLSSVKPQFVIYFQF